MLQLLVINGGAAAAESESVSPWDGGCVAALCFSVLLLCKYKGTFLLHSRTDAEYFSFCVNLNVPSLVLRPFPKARLNVFGFPSSLVGEGQSRATKDARICLPASAPPLSLRCLSWRCLRLSVALTPVASRSVAPNSRQRPQTGWLQITFSSKEEKCVREGEGGGGERTLHPSLRPWKPRRCLTTARSLRPPASLTSLKAPENTALPLRLRAFGVQFS